MYAFREASAWQMDTFDGNGLNPSLALDASGTAHISYLTGGGGELSYAMSAGSSWEIEALEPASLGETSIALYDGQPRISF